MKVHMPWHKDIKHIPKAEIAGMIVNLESEMKKEAEELNFERAIEIRDKINELKKKLDD